MTRRRRSRWPERSFRSATVALLESIGIIALVAGAVVTGGVVALQKVGLMKKPKTYDSEEAQTAAAVAWRQEAEANAARAERLESMYAALEARVDELKAKLATVEEKNAELEKRPDFGQLADRFTAVEVLLAQTVKEHADREVAFLSFLETATNRLEEIATAVVPPLHPAA